MGGYAAQQALEAIHTLLNVDGAGSFAEKNRMQQYRRDANTAARHPGLNDVVGREVYGKSLLAVEERISPGGVIAVLQERWSAWIALTPDRRNPITPER